jgi:branched-chain amino acid transport system substrate-binding protein
MVKLPTAARAMLVILALMGALAAGPRMAGAEEVGVTADSIKIGIAAPFTGPVSMWGYPLVRPGTLVFEEANEKGGIHGRKLIMVEEDDQCDPSKGVAVAKKLIHEHKVFLIHGLHCSNVALAVRPEVQKAKVPWLPAATNDKVFVPVDPYVFTNIHTAEIEARLMADFAMTVPNAKRIALIAHRDSWGLAKSEPLTQRLQDQYKMSLVANEALDRNANDSTPQTLRLKEANPDVVLVVLYPKEAAIFLRDAQKYGLNGVFVGSSSLEDVAELAKRAGSEATVKSFFSLSPLKYTMDDPKIAPLLDKLKAHYPNVTVIPTGLWTHSGAELIVEVLKRVGRDLTREKFVKELDKLQGFETTVFAGNLSFSPSEHRGNQTANFFALRGGRVVSVGQKYVPTP